MSAEKIQSGGNHYKKMAIQPMRFSMENGLDACQHTAIKYIARFRDKGGIADLEKAKHTIDLLIMFERERAQQTGRQERDGWIEHNGVGRPVHGDAKVDVKLSNGAVLAGRTVNGLCWAHDDIDIEPITHWRAASAEPAPE